MKRRFSILLSCGFLGGCAAPANDYLKKVNIALPVENYQDVSDKQEAGREVASPMSLPFPDDFPPSRTIVLKDPRPYPSLSEPKYAFPAQNVVRFYDLRNVGEERTVRGYVKQLEKAMRERKPTPPPGSRHDLPDYPTHNAGFLVQHKISYHDYAWGSGVFYLAQFTQSRGNFPNNEELCYQFQGLSKDGRMYVSAAFRVTHPILPATMSFTPDTDDIDAYADKLAYRLDQQADDSFSPGLSVIRGWIQSIKLPE